MSYIIWKVFESTFRNRFRLSVCTTIFKRIAELCFYLKCLMLYINGFFSTSTTNLWKAFFSNFKFVFELMAENLKIFKRIARREYWSNCNVLSGISMESSWQALHSYQWKAFFHISNSFSNYCQKPENIHRITRLGLCKRGGEAFVLISTRYSEYIYFIYLYFWTHLLNVWTFDIYSKLVMKILWKNSCVSENKHFFIHSTILV